MNLMLITRKLSNQLTPLGLFFASVQKRQSDGDIKRLLNSVTAGRLLKRPRL